jgi:hypothetical protein
MGVNSQGEHGSPAYVDRRLIAGGALLMAGGFLACLAGATIGAVAAVNAGRRYVAAREEPPAVTARRRWEQARTATAAGYGAWQQHGRKVATGIVR